MKEGTLSPALLGTAHGALMAETYDDGRTVLVAAVPLRVQDVDIVARLPELERRLEILERGRG
jgi:hypothetical protein